MTSPEEWDDLDAQEEARERSEARRDLIACVAMVVVAGALVAAAVVWGFGGWRS